MTLSQDIAALREALDKGPQRWFSDSNMTPFYNDAEGLSRGGDPDGTYCIFGDEIVIDGERYDGPVLSDRCGRADADFITECHPDRIRHLLDALEEAQKDAERYQLRYETLRALYPSAPAEQELDAAIDTAMSKEKQA